MSLTLVTNPVGSAAQKIFAGFDAINFVFKREDLTITGVVNGTGGIKINVETDLTSYLSIGDVIYIYSVGTNHTYNNTGTILDIDASTITIDVAYVESATGGYINYLKNYYVDLQCVNPTFNDVNLLPFSLQADGDAAGNITIDVSIVNDLNTQRGAIVQGALTNSVKSFLVKYKPVYTGSTETYTVVTGKLVIAVFAVETPEENEVLNKFDVPKLYLGYPGSIVVANSGGTAGNNKRLAYSELDINKVSLASSNLGDIDAGNNGFLLWKWLSNAVVNDKTKYIEFDVVAANAGDFASPDFASPDFKIT